MVKPEDDTRKTRDQVQQTCVNPNSAGCQWRPELYIRKHLKEISIGIAEEQRAMSKGLIGGR